MGAHGGCRHPMRPLRTPFTARVRASAFRRSERLEIDQDALELAEAWEGTAHARIDEADSRGIIGPPGTLTEADETWSTRRMHHRDDRERRKEIGGGEPPRKRLEAREEAQRTESRRAKSRLDILKLQRDPAVGQDRDRGAGRSAGTGGMWGTPTGATDTGTRHRSVYVEHCRHRVDMRQMVPDCSTATETATDSGWPCCPFCLLLALARR